MRKIILLGLIIILLAFILFWIDKKELGNKTALFANLQPDFHQSGFFEFKNQIIENLEKNDYKNYQNNWTQIGITSHHLPTALTFIADFYKAISNFQGPRKIFVIFGPDHFERCSARISTTQKYYQTPFGDLSLEREIVNKLLAAGIGLDDKCFEGEHSIGVQTIFIKYLFPDAKIVPLLFSSSTNDVFINKIIEVLSDYQDDITVVASVDFSHHQDYEAALRLDKISEEKIKNFGDLTFSLDYTDSPASIKTAILLARKFNHQNPVIIGRANSYDFTERVDDTTGYINAVFTK